MSVPLICLFLEMNQIVIVIFNELYCSYIEKIDRNNLLRFKYTEHDVVDWKPFHASFIFFPRCLRGISLWRHCAYVFSNKLDVVREGKLSYIKKYFFLILCHRNTYTELTFFYIPLKYTFRVLIKKFSPKYLYIRESLIYTTFALIRKRLFHSLNTCKQCLRK